MKLEEIAAKLREHNAWRRGDESLKMMHPKELGEVIETGADMLVRLAEFTASDEFAERCYNRYQFGASMAEICQAVIDQLREEVTL